MTDDKVANGQFSYLLCLLQLNPPRVSRQSTQIVNAAQSVGHDDVVVRDSPLWTGQFVLECMSERPAEGRRGYRLPDGSHGTFVSPTC